MSIYDVRLYGACCPSRWGRSYVFISNNIRQVLSKGALNEAIFEVTVLKSFEGKTDVLQLTYEDNSKAYETLYGEGYTYIDGEWKKGIIFPAANAFLDAYNKLAKNKK